MLTPLSSICAPPLAFNGPVTLGDRPGIHRTAPIPFLRPASEEDRPAGLVALSLIERVLPIHRRLMRPGDKLFEQGVPVGQIFVVNSGCLKLLTREVDGRERITKFRFKGDWLGLDGLYGGHYRCDAICMDTGEAWGFTYAELLLACQGNPALLDTLLKTAAYELSAASGHMMTMCTLPTQARVAQFLCNWVDALKARQLRTDRITLRLSREEIGSHLGMTLESVSRSLSLLDRRGLLHFIGKGRREICIPDVAALLRFVQTRGVA